MRRLGEFNTEMTYQKKKNWQKITSNILEMFVQMNTGTNTTMRDHKRVNFVGSNKR